MFVFLATSPHNQLGCLFALPFADSDDRSIFVFASVANQIPKGLIVSQKAPITDFPAT